MLTCQECGRLFLSDHPQRAKYCSLGCFADSQRGRRKKPIQWFVCRFCGQSFEPAQKGDRTPSHLLRNPPQYCSRSCRDSVIRTRVSLTCRQCGQEFARKAYMKDWSKERGPFCSMACYGNNILDSQAFLW